MRRERYGDTKEMNESVLQRTGAADRKSWQKSKGHEEIGKPNTVQVLQLNKFREGGQKCLELPSNLKMNKKIPECW